MATDKELALHSAFSLVEIANNDLEYALGLPMDTSEEVAEAFQAIYKTGKKSVAAVGTLLSLVTDIAG